MSNALVVSGDMSDAEINAALGLVEAPQKVGIPRLKINSKPLDKDDNPQPMGQFYLAEGKDMPRYYAKDVTIRVVTRAYQYSWFDSQSSELKDISVLRNSYKQRGDRDKFISMSGKPACGKLTQKVLEELGNSISAEQAEIQKNVKFNMVFFVLVSFTGTNPETKETKEYVNVPAIFQRSFNGGKSLDDMISSMVSENRATMRYNIKLNTKKEENGNVIYYVILPTLDNKPVAMSTEDVAVANTAREFINRENLRIQKMFETGITGERLDKQAEEINVEIPHTMVDDDDLDDEIPF